MRILQVSDSYLPRLGGIELHVHDLAVRQRAYGHSVSVATVTPGPQAVGSSLLRLPGLHSFPRPRGMAELSHLIEFGRFNVIHVHSSLVSPLAWAGAVAGTRSEIPTVLTMHSMLPGGVTARSLRALSPRLGYERRLDGSQLRGRRLTSRCCPEP